MSKRNNSKLTGLYLSFYNREVIINTKAVMSSYDSKIKYLKRSVKGQKLQWHRKLKIRKDHMLLCEGNFH